jgi:uroporphyrinogen-III synthase
VRRALELLRARRAGKAWPARLAVATVGQGSREELQAQGFAEVLAPAGRADSEALLALPALAGVRGKRIVIFRGDGGRPLLGDELGKRGAFVEYAACYRRARPSGAGALAWPVHAVTVSSAEGLENFLQLAGEDAAHRLAEVPVFVPHARVAAEARRLGLRQVIVAGPRDEEVAAALVAYFGGAG